MDTLLIDFRHRCLESLLDLLLRQWCSLGVAGHGSPARPDRLIDLEALVLATTSIGRHDPRLFDEALDWLSSFGTLINLQRLINLQMGHELGDLPVLQAIADWLAQRAAQPRWRAVSRIGQTSVSSPQLHSHVHGIARPPAAVADDIFDAQGLEPGRFQPRGMSRAPQPLLPPNLMFSLRALIGINARVEIILFLVGSPSAAKATEIARATGYAPRTLQATLQEMLLSGHLLSQEPALGRASSSPRGAQRRYQLQPADWGFLTGGQPLPRWTPWAAVFGIARAVLAAIPSPGESPRHPAVVSSRVRDALVAHSPALASAGLLPQFDLRPEASGEELMTTLAERMPLLIADL